AAPGPTPTSNAEIPVSISSVAAWKPTQLPTTTGTGNSRQSLLNDSVGPLVELNRAVLTVDWTTKTSTPASTARRPSRSAWGGVPLPAVNTPGALIPPIRRPTSSSRNGA